MGRRMISILGFDLRKFEKSKRPTVAHVSEEEEEEKEAEELFSQLQKKKTPCFLKLVENRSQNLDLTILQGNVVL